jgi:hypothetical protein
MNEDASRSGPASTRRFRGVRAERERCVGADANGDERLYSALLARHLRRGPLYPVKTVMTAHRYPERRYVHLFYAQSASLVRYLRSLGRRGEPAVRNARLLRFLNSASKVGVEAALRQVYAIGGYPDLQRRWLAFARQSKLAR